MSKLIIQSSRRRQRQAGVVLLITLIMLVAMTLAGVALIRSVYTTTLIAGNMAMQQAALASGTVGTEAAIAWIETTNLTANALDVSQPALGYSAQRRVPPSGISWDSYWTNTIVPSNSTVSLATDSSGNSVQYIIDRMCNGQGSITAGIQCARSQVTPPSDTSSKSGGNAKPAGPPYVFYRIVARVQGPRSTASYIETMIAK